VTQVIIDAATIAVRRIDSSADIDHQEDARKRFTRMWPPVLAFTLGAACGASGYAWVKLWCLIVPATLCLVLAVRFDRG